MRLPSPAKLRPFIPSRTEAIKLVARLGWDAVTFPMTVAALLYNPRIDPSYGLTAWGKVQLALRMYRNGFRVLTATSFKAHLAMASKVLEIPPSTEGVVVECGSFLGGSAANLSLVCDLVDRQLIIYDSFEGLPPAEEGDAYGVAGATGFLRGDLERVRANISRCGVIERCTFRKGWFSDTLPHHAEPIVACFLDVDYQSSLHDCVTNLWPHLTPQGYLFLDEYVGIDYCALFWSERFWQAHFDTTPPGLIGAGSGVPIGHYYLGPFPSYAPLQSASSIAWTRKDFNGYWGYDPDEQRAGGEPPSDTTGS